MSITRRKFLKAGTLFALSAAIPLNATGQQIPKGNDGNPIDQSKDIAADPLSHYTRSAFSSYLNSIFRLYTGYSFVDVALVEVKDLMPWAAKAQTGAECFSLVFRGGSTALPQNTYMIEHPSLGTFQLFLVPGGADENGGQSYVAIVNRLAYSPALLVVPSSTKTATPSPDERISNRVQATPAEPPKKTRLPRKRRRGEEGFDVSLDRVNWSCPNIGTAFR
jgi:hypothetical protein